MDVSYQVFLFLPSAINSEDTAQSSQGRPIHPFYQPLCNMLF